MKEKVYLLKIADEKFDPVKLTRLGYSIQELEKGTHVIKVDDDGGRKFDRWLPDELIPSTKLGIHALIQVIIHVTAERFNTTMEHLCSRDKRREVDSVRKLAIHMCCEAFRSPLAGKSGVQSYIHEMIGNNLNRCRSGVLKTDQWVVARLDILPDFVASIAVLKERIVELLPLDEQYITKRFGEDGVSGER